MILGLDPATSKPVGYGILTMEGRLMTSGIWRLHGRNAIARLYDFRRWLVALYEEWPKIAWCGIESPHAKYPKVAIRLGQAGGVAMSCAFKHGVAVVEVAPLQAKKAITGGGRATKAEVQAAVKERFSIDAEVKEDAADALAVAYCVWQQLNKAFDDAQ